MPYKKKSPQASKYLLSQVDALQYSELLTLRWLAGGSYLDISDLHGIHPATMYRHVWQTMRAIDKAYHFQLLRQLNELDVEGGRSTVGWWQTAEEKPQKDLQPRL